MAKIEVKDVLATETLTEKEPRWIVVVSYGPGDEIEIPLPARHLQGDDWAQNFAESLEGMERLARALLDFVEHRRRLPHNDLD
jgi:hypothetical protein